MRVMAGLLIILFCVASVSAFNTSEINATALSLRGADNASTAYAVEGWVRENVAYQFYEHPLGVTKTWEWKKGDCTDQNLLIRVMLRPYGIFSYPEYGWCRIHIPYQRDYVGLHDWTVAAIDDNYIILDATATCDNYDAVGYGIWGFPWIEKKWDDLAVTNRWDDALEVD